MGSTAAYPTPLACGRLSFSLGIAGEHWEIRSTSPDLLLSVADRTREFLEAEVSAKPEVSISSEWADTIPLLSDPVFDAGLWRAYKDTDGTTFDFASDVLGPAPYKRAKFNHDMSYGHVLLNRECLDLELAWNPLEYPLDELLMMNRLALGRGAELHSCGVSVAGQGYLFAGHSGAGKSTTAKLWVENRRGTILSDDRIIIRRVGSSFEMHGTPWHGEAGLAQKSSVPL